ncbi:MAG: hypothetical protein ACYCU7_04700 [Acidimicrobiales bacterium]
MTTALVVDALILAWFLYRQRKVRRVPARLGLRIPLLLAAIGVVEVADFSRQYPLRPAVVGILVLTLAVAAVGLGAVRALTVRLWAADGIVLRQGTWLTIALWLVSLGTHLAAAAWIGALKGPGGLPSASLLLFLGLTYGVQRAVVHRRALRLAAALRPIDVRADDVGGARRPPRQPGRPPPGADRRAIEVRSEVVEHDDRHRGVGGDDHAP